MKQGFNIVIGGRNFEPEKMKWESRNLPDVIVRKGEKQAGKVCEESFVEWDCWKDEFGELDIIAEALDFVNGNQDQLLAISTAHGVEYRYLNIVMGNWHCIELSAENIKLLAQVSLSLSVCDGVSEKGSLRQENTDREN